jgi:hypothetical protein
LGEAIRAATRPPSKITDVSLWPQLGCTDVTLDVKAPEENHGGEGTGEGRIDERATCMSAGYVIPWYFDSLLPRVAQLTTSTEMRLGIPTRPAEKREHLSRHIVLGRLQPPDDFLRRAEETTAGASVAACIRNMCNMMNVAAANDGLYGLIADLYLHTRAFLLRLDDLATTSTPPQFTYLLATASVIASAFFAGLGQRLRGSYYDLTIDKPEFLLEHVGGQQKTLVGLWSVQKTLIDSLTGQSNAVRAYWVVSREAHPGLCIGFIDTCVFQLGSALAFDLRSAVHALGHEIGHAVQRVLRTTAGQGQTGEAPLLQPNQPLEDLPEWGDVDWRVTTVAMSAEVFADLFSFFLLLGTDLGAYRTSIANVVGRVRRDDKYSVAQLALRVAMAHACAEAYPRPSEAADPFWVARTYGAAPPEEAVDVLPIETDAPEQALDGFLEAWWRRTREGYAEYPREVLDSGWREAQSFGWLQPAVLDYLELSAQSALSTSAWCLGYEMAGVGSQSRLGQAAEELCRILVPGDGVGGSKLRDEDVIETLWAKALQGLGREIENLEAPQGG